MTPTAADLVACAKREIAFRRRVYPRQVAQGKMSQGDADHEVACQVAIIQILTERLEPKLL